MGYCGFSRFRRGWRLSPEYWWSFCHLSWKGLFPHITLSYMVLIPAAWLLTIKILEGNFSVKNTVLINLVILVATFIHIYYFLMLIIFIWLMLFLDTVYSRLSLRRNLKVLGSTLIVAIGIILLIKFIGPYSRPA